MKAGMTCFNAQLEALGGSGNCQQRRVLEQVATFFEAYGASRFRHTDVLT